MFKPKLEVPVVSAKLTSTREEPVKNREVAAADDSKPPSIDTKRVHDRDGGDFYISY